MGKINKLLALMPISASLRGKIYRLKAHGTKSTIGNHVYIGAGCIVNLGVKICDNVVLQSGTCVNKSIHETGVYASNTFLKSGEVRRYDEICKDNPYKELSTGIKVFLKQER